ncbi:MAG TPA: pentapeptide repeat-containing protein [Caulobacteraceae bacterium]|nr:pentapeptide repeat-containing protein [Caulobacteraceae bacterium]
MKSVALIIVLSLAAAAAFAQNTAEVGRAQDGASCPRCDLFQADLSNRDLAGRDFTGARLQQADLSVSVFDHARFGGDDLRDVNGYGARFTGADFAGANMTNATFVGAYLDGADLRGANLSGVNFSGAELARAVGLSQSQLNTACGDQSTTLPAGMHLPVCR